MLSTLLALAALGRPAPDSLRLAEALQRARARGAVAAAGALADAARGDLRLAGSIPNPVARWSHTDAPPSGHATLEQSFDWALTRGPARSAARAAVSARLADSVQRAADVAADARVAFYRALRAVDGVRAAVALQALADSVTSIADARLASGDISAADRDQIALEAARGRLALSEAAEARALAMADLARAIGGFDGQVTRDLAGRLDDGFVPGPPPPSDLAPAAESAVFDSTAAAARVTESARARVPLPALELGAEYTDPSLPGRTLAVVGLSMPLPLWQRGGAELALARARAAEASAQLRETRAALTAAERALRAQMVETAARAIELRDSIVPGAAQARARATRAYAAGETGVLPVLEALRSERQVGAAMLDAFLAWQVAIAEWKRLHRMAE